MEIAAAAKEMIDQLDELLELGFSGREYDKVYQMIAGAAHNDIIDFPEYRAVVQKFLLERKPKTDGS